MAEAAELMYTVNADDHKRSIMRAHRKWQEVYATEIDERARAEAERDAAVARLDAAVAQVAEKDKEIADLLRRLEQYES